MTEKNPFVGYMQTHSYDKEDQPKTIEVEGELIEITNPEDYEQVEPGKKKHWIRTRKFSWWLKLPFRLAIGLPLCLFFAFLVLIFLGRTGARMLWNVVKFAFREEPEIAKERLKEFQQYLRDGRK